MIEKLTAEIARARATIAIGLREAGYSRAIAIGQRAS